MPDNVTVNSVPVATRSVTYSGDASQNAQVIGLVAFSGSDDAKTATDLPGDATNGLDVDVTRVVPGTAATELGKAEDAAHSDGDTGVLLLGVRNYGGAGSDGDYSALSMSAAGAARVEPSVDMVRISVTSAGLTTATTAYTAGDQVGDKFTIANAARASDGGGYIVGVTLIDESDIIGAYDVVFYDTSVTPAADNAAFSISSDADAIRTVAVVPLSTYDTGANRIAQSGPIRIPYVCNGGTSLYALLVTRAGHTFFGATTSLKLVVYVERNG